MRPQVILVVSLAVFGVLAAIPLGEAAGSSSWPCCDACGACTRMIPPKCRCNDISVHGCHRECKKCVTNTVAADKDGVQKLPGGGPGPVVTYRCDDRITNFCQRSCTAAAPAAAAPAAAAFLGAVF